MGELYAALVHSGHDALVALLHRSVGHADYGETDPAFHHGLYRNRKRVHALDGGRINFRQHTVSVSGFL